MRTSRSRRIVVSMVAIVAVVVAGSPALGGLAFAPTVVLRTAPAPRDLNVSEIAAKGANVGVVWQEQDDGTFGDPDGDPRLRYRISTNGGQTFQATELIDTRDSVEAQADICGGFLWVVSSLHLEGDPDTDWSVVRDGFDLDGPAFSGTLISAGAGENARVADIACIGSRRQIISWTEEAGATDDFHVTFHTLPHGPDVPLPVEFGPYNANRTRFPAVAATGSHAYAAWTRPGTTLDDAELRFKRFDIGPGPASMVTGHPIISLPETTDPLGWPKLAAQGDLVILAYMHEADLFVRRSTNGGMSFGPRLRLVDAPFPSEVAAVPLSVDLRGSEAVINATVAGGVFEISATQLRFRSTNSGMSWIEDDLGGEGDRVGAFSRLAGETRLVEAWDRFFEPDDPQKLRFHRET